MDYDTALRQATLSLGILLFAFTFGVLTFAGVAFALGPVAQEPESLQVLRWVALGLPLVELPVALQLWIINGKRLREAEGWQARIAALRARTIVIAAMFEAPALFAGVVMLLLGFSWHVLPAFALFLAGMLALAPTPRRVQQLVGKADGTLPDQYS